VVDENGGEVVGPGFVLSVPPGSLPGLTDITVRPATPAELPLSLGPRRDSIVSGTLYDFGPDGLVFDPPAVITLEYDPLNLPAGTDESRLGVARIDSVLTAIPVLARDTVANTISAQVDHFTFFGVVLPQLTLDLSINVVIEETISVTDELPIESTPPVNVLVEENISVTDSLPIESAPPVNVIVEEIVSVTDLLPIESSPPLTLVVEETIQVLDELGSTGLAPIRIDVLEAVGVSDATGSDITGLPDVTAIATETVAVADVVAVDAPGVVRIDIEEAVGVTDSPGSEQLDLLRSDVSESIMVADDVAVTAPGIVRIDVVEGIGVGDSPSPSVPVNLSVPVTESVGVVDVVDVRATSSGDVYVGSGTAILGAFDADLSSVASVALPGQVGAVARRPGTSGVWVVERGSDSLVVVDAATNTRTTAIYSGTLDPIAIDFDASGNVAVVGDNNADRITVFDAASVTQSGPAITNFGVPSVTGVQLSGDGSTAWIVGNNVAKVDVAARQPLDTAEIGGITFASDVDLTPDETELWVTDALSGNVVIYDAVTLAVLDTISISDGTSTGGEQLTISDDGATAFATTATFGELVALDVATRSESARYTIGGSASFVVLDAANSVVFLTSLQPDDELIRFDLSAGAVTDRVPFASPRGLILFR